MYGNDDIEDELRKIQNLLENSYISQEEYDRRKSEITGVPVQSGNVGNPPTPTPTPTPTPSYDYNNYNNYYNNNNDNYHNNYYNDSNNNNNYYNDSTYSHTTTTSKTNPYSLSTNMDIDEPVIPILNSSSTYDYNNNSTTTTTTPTYTYTNNNNYNNNNNKPRRPYNNNNNTNNNNNYQAPKSTGFADMFDTNKSNNKPIEQTAAPPPPPRSTGFADMFATKPTLDDELSKAMNLSMDLNVLEVEGGETQSHIKFRALSTDSKKVYVDLKGWKKEVPYSNNAPSINTDDWKTAKIKQQNILRNRLIYDNVNGLNASEKNSNIKLIGGCDISFPKESKIDAVASIVVLEYPSCKVVFESYKMIKLTEPYVAGYLAFREVPHFLDIWNVLIKKYPQYKPDLMILDGNGINHQRSVGAASHFGIIADIPSIGVAKNLLVAKGITPEYIQTGFATSNTVEMIDRNDKNRIVGHAIHNHDGEIIYISPGHKMDANTALQVVRKCLSVKIGHSTFHRPIPEPTYQADHLSRVFINQFYKSFK